MTFLKGSSVSGSKIGLKNVWLTFLHLRLHRNNPSPLLSLLDKISRLGKRGAKCTEYSGRRKRLSGFRFLSSMSGGVIYFQFKQYVLP